ncbi:hypothetical protein [Halorussus litoreus]
MADAEGVRPEEIDACLYDVIEPEFDHRTRSRQPRP